MNNYSQLTVAVKQIPSLEANNCSDAELIQPTYIFRLMQNVRTALFIWNHF
jgi:hypothetical protein